MAKDLKLWIQAIRKIPPKRWWIIMQVWWNGSIGHAWQCFWLRNQFWKDMVNRDLLRILDVSLENGVEYARCACFAHGLYFGIQEMKASRLDQARFQRVGKLKTLWYMLKHAKIQRGAPKK